MEQEKFRHELKYGIGYLQYLELRNRLQAVMKGDAHAEAAGRCRKSRKGNVGNYWKAAGIG